MSDQDWPPATRGTLVEFETAWQHALQQHCPLMPSQRHCWHEPHGLWDGNFPPPLVCCWCGEASGSMNEVPQRHGPHVPDD